MKAILEIEMPESCADCRFAVRGKVLHEDRYVHYCSASDDVKTLMGNSRNRLCPLKVSSETNDDKNVFAENQEKFLKECEKYGTIKHEKQKTCKWFCGRRCPIYSGTKCDECDIYEEYI